MPHLADCSIHLLFCTKKVLPNIKSWSLLEYLVWMSFAHSSVHDKEVLCFQSLQSLYYLKDFNKVTPNFPHFQRHQSSLGKSFFIGILPQAGDHLRHPFLHIFYIICPSGCMFSRSADNTLNVVLPGIHIILVYFLCSWILWFYASHHLIGFWHYLYYVGTWNQCVAC